MKKKITIITPTYNRAYILDRCYQSLINQTVESFIWMVVDDGSNDDTEELVRKWVNENKITIEYYKKENGGKASALNYAFDRVSTDYLVCLDSDDMFVPSAVEVAVRELDEKVQKVSYFCGMIALKSDTNGKIIGGVSLPDNVTSSTPDELMNKYKLTKAEHDSFYDAKIIKGFRFPVFEGEKFVSPSYLNLVLSDKYKFAISHYIYTRAEYMEDGLSRNRITLIKNNPKGYTIVKKLYFMYSNNLIVKSKHALMYIAGSLLSRNKNFIKNSPNKVMTILLFPLGWLIYKKRF